MLAQEAVPRRPSLWKQWSKYILKSIKKFSLWDYLQKQLPKDHSTLSTF